MIWCLIIILVIFGFWSLDSFLNKKSKKKVPYDYGYGYECLEKSRDYIEKEIIYFVDDCYQIKKLFINIEDLSMNSSVSIFGGSFRMYFEFPILSQSDIEYITRGLKNIKENSINTINPNFSMSVLTGYQFIEVTIKNKLICDKLNNKMYRDYISRKSELYDKFYN